MTTTRTRRPSGPATLLSLAAGLAAAAVAAVPAGAALLPPIDDCERGAFSLMTNTGSIVADTVAIPGHPSHAISSERIVTLTASNQPGPFTTASLTPAFTDDSMVISIADGGFCDVRYEWPAPKDLTFGGTLQWVEMDVAAPQASDQVTMTVSDGTSQTGFSQTFQFGGRETLAWGAGFMNPSVLSQATSITFHFHPGQNGTDFQVWDIRFRATGSSPVTLAGTSVSAQTPPVPSGPLTFTTFESGSTLYDANVAIADAMTDAMVVPAADWTWTKTSGLGGEWAEMSLLWTEPGGVQEADFEISVDLAEVDGGLVPELYPPDPIHDPASVLLHFPVALRSSPGGSVQAVSDTWLSLDVVEGQGLEVQNVSVTGNPVAPSWSSGFTLSFRMAITGSPDDQAPLLTATWISDYSAQVTTDAATIAGAAGGETPLRLTAAPSVTRGGTHIRASRPFERAGIVLIHDVAGRVVRKLSVARGEESVRWNGVSSSGRPVAAGVYFVRLEAEASRAARIVRVR